jgi:hypothetical protein
MRRFEGREIMLAQLFVTTTARRHESALLRVGVAAALAVMLTGVAFADNARSARGGPGSRGNAVTHWNTVATNAFAPSQGTNPMAQSRALAILHAAMHDAVNAINRRFEPYTPGVLPAPRASLDAAVAAAARDVLVTFVPDQAAMIDAAYAQALAPIPDTVSKSAGIFTGQMAAALNMNRRLGDGSENGALPVYEPRPGPGEYQFTPPFNFAAQPSWGRVKPFIIDLEDHAIDDPLPLNSPAYALDLAYLKAIGKEESRFRTSEQSEIAEFWYEDSPLGWNRIANTAVRTSGLDPWSAARTLALVNFAMADGFIAGFEAKYRYRFWRPETAIRAAATDGNPLTSPDATWQPFLITPPVPDHPSTHTVLGWAAAQVLIELLGDKMRFNADSLTLPGVVRDFKRFSAAADENGLSRLYAGIHFVHAVKEGRRQGRSIGRNVADALPPVR